MQMMTKTFGIAVYLPLCTLQHGVNRMGFEHVVSVQGRSNMQRQSLPSCMPSQLWRMMLLPCPMSVESWTSCAHPVWSSILNCDASQSLFRSLQGLDVYHSTAACCYGLSDMRYMACVLSGREPGSCVGAGAPDRLAAVSVRLHCQLWRETGHNFNKLRELLLPDRTQLRMTEVTAISKAAALREVCRHDVDRGVQLIEGIQVDYEQFAELMHHKGSRYPVLQGWYW